MAKNVHRLCGDQDLFKVKEEYSNAWFLFNLFLIIEIFALDDASNNENFQFDNRVNINFKKYLKVNYILMIKRHKYFMNCSWKQSKIAKPNFICIKAVYAEKRVLFRFEQQIIEILFQFKMESAITIFLLSFFHLQFYLRFFPSCNIWDNFPIYLYYFL